MLINVSEHIEKNVMQLVINLCTYQNAQPLGLVSRITIHYCQSIHLQLLKLNYQDYVHTLKTKRYVDYIKHSFEVILI